MSHEDFLQYLCLSDKHLFEEAEQTRYTFQHSTEHGDTH